MPSIIVRLAILMLPVFATPSYAAQHPASAGVTTAVVAPKHRPARLVRNVDTEQAQEAHFQAPGANAFTLVFALLLLWASGRIVVHAPRAAHANPALSAFRLSRNPCSSRSEVPRSD